MDEWVIWLVAAAAAGVGELATGGAFFLAPFALGALVAAIAAGLGAPGLVVWLLFAVITVVTLLALRPIARRHLVTPARLRTGTAALVGQTATVVTDIDNHRDHGQIRLSGELWTARSLDDDESIDAGRRVSVVEIRGATAVVVPHP